MLWSVILAGRFPPEARGRWLSNERGFRAGPTPPRSPRGSRAPPFSRWRCRWVPAADPAPGSADPPASLWGGPSPSRRRCRPRPRSRLRGGKRCLRRRFLGARPSGEAGPRRANGAAAALLPWPTAPPDGPQPPGRTSATRARRTLPSRPAVPLLVPGCAEPGPAGFVAPRPSRRYPPSLPHSPGPVALPAPLLSLLVPVADGGGGAAPGSCASCGAAEPPLAPSFPGPPAPPPRPARLPGP